MNTRTLLVAGLYLAGIVAANELTAHLGLVSAGFGLLVTAGTWAAGAVLALRNALQETAGRRWVTALIVVGAILSWLLGSGRIAIASGVTFLIAETLGTTVYSRLRRNGWRRAAVAGTWVGAIADTGLFLWLAGFPISAEIVAGQLLIKGLWSLVGYLALAEVVRRVVVRKPLHAESA